MSKRALREAWDALSAKAKADMFKVMTPGEKSRMVTSWEFLARLTQLAPENWGSDQPFWLFIGGRGVGKTRTGAETMLNHIEELGKTARVALIAPTASDARDVMIEGESGIVACAHRRGLKCTYEPSKRRISFDNGAVATAFSAEKPDRLRGPQHTFAWCDEVSSWEYDQETWDMMEFGLRLGPCPKVLVTTTPKPRVLMKSLMRDKRSLITKGSTFDNKENLAPQFIQAIKQRYEGTRLGRQELYGELLEDNPDSLWDAESIEAKRIREGDTSPDELIFKYDLIRIVVAVDPAMTSGEKADETGLLVLGRDRQGRLYVLDDRSGRYSPDKWATVVSDLYDKWSADRVIAERNQGGDLVEYTLRTVAPNIPYTGVVASKGKRTRAEPVAALYEQGKVHHVGHFQELEDQMVMFSPTGYDGNDDRMDALVWGLTDLALTPGRGGISFI